MISAFTVSQFSIHNLRRVASAVFTKGLDLLWFKLRCLDLLALLRTMVSRFSWQVLRQPKTGVQVVRR
jgi:hypothetical protein